MKTIKLLKLEIENFKGVKKFAFEPKGKNATVSAENGIGKTTLKDAYLWCMFGKNAEGDSKFGLRPVDKDNKPIKGLTVAVELTLDIDGTISVFTKEHKEKFVKKQSKGFTTKCTIDEVDLPITKYDARIAEIIPFDPFKILSDPYYFNNEDKFPWLKRRGVNLELAGEIGTPEGFGELLAALEGRSMDDYKKVLKTRIKAATVRRDEINPRIDENQLKLDDYAENAVDTFELEKQRHDLKGEIAAFDLQRNNIIAEQDERQGKINAVNDLKDSLAERERFLKNDTSGVQGLLDEKAEIVKGVADKLALLAEAENTIGYKKSEIEAAQKIVDSRQSSFVQARDAYLTAKNTPIVEPPAIEGLCFSCNQPLPEEMKASAGDDRQKAIDLLTKLRVENVKLLGGVATAAGESVKEQRAVVAKLVDDLVGFQDDLDKATIVYDESAAYRDQRFTGIDEALNGQKPIDTSKDAEVMDIKGQIAVAEAEVGEPAGDQLTKIEADRATSQEKLEDIARQLLQADAAKEIGPRIDELKAEETAIGQAIAGWESELEDIKNYNQAECLLIESDINGKFKHVKWRLFKPLLKKKDGSDEADTVPCCDAMLDGVVHQDMSDGEEIFSGTDIINVLSEHYGLSVPLFIDRAESFTKEREATSQTIELHAVKGVTALDSFIGTHEDYLEKLYAERLKKKVKVS